VRRLLSILRRTLLVVFVMLTVVVVATVALVGWLHTDRGRAWLLDTVHEQVAAAAGIDVEIGVLEGWLLWNATLRDVRLAALDDEQDWISCERLSLRWRPWRLVRGVVSIDAIELVGPRVDQTRMPAFASADSTETVEEPSQPFALPLAVRLEHLSVERGAVVAAPGVHLDSLAVVLDGEAWSIVRKLHARVRIERASAYWVEQDLSCPLVSGHAELAGAQLTSAFEAERLSAELTAPLRWRDSEGRLAATATDGGYTAVLVGELRAGQLAVLREEMADHPAIKLGLRGEGALARDQLRHRATLAVDSAAGNVGLETSVDGAPLVAKASVSGVDPARWWNTLPGGSLGARLDVEVGDPLAPTQGAQVTVRVDSSAVGMLVIDGATVDARLAGELVQVDTLSVTATATRVEGHGHFAGLDDLAATITADLDDLSVWGDVIGRTVQGTVEVDARVAGGLTALDGQVDVHVRGLEASELVGRPLHAGRLDLQASARGDTADMQLVVTCMLDDVETPGVKLGATGLDGNATIVARQLTQASVALDASVDTLAVLPRLAGATLHTRAAARRDEQGTLVAQVDSLNLHGRRGRRLLALESPLHVRYGPAGELEVEGLDLRLPTGSLRGELHRGVGDLAVDLDLSSIDLAEVKQLVPVSPVESGIVNGRVTVAGDSRGLAGDVLVDAGAVRLPGFDPIDAEVGATLAPDSVEIDLQMVTAGDDSVSVRGQAPLRVLPAAPWWEWREGAHFALAVNAAADSALAWLGQELLDGSKVVVECQLAGTPHDVELDLLGHFVPAPIGALPVLELGLATQVGGGLATTHVSGVAAGDSLLVGRAEIPLALDLVDGAAIDTMAAVAGRVAVNSLDLRYLEIVLGDLVETAGRLDVNTTVTGTLDDPDLDGTLTIADGRVDVDLIGFTLEDLVLDATFDKRRVTIREGRATSGEGSLNLSGSLPTMLTPEDELDFHVKANRIGFDLAMVRRASINLDLHLSGSRREPSLRGTIRVNAATIPIPDRGNRTYLELTEEDFAAYGDTAQARSVATAGGGAELPITLDLKVEIPRNFWIRNRQIEIEIGGDLALASVGEAVDLTGQLSTIRGRVEFLGQRFDVDRGVVTFIGDTNPELDIDAIAEIDQWTVHILVLGNAEKPQISFNSEPPLSEADVLSLIMFGQTASGLSEGERFTMADRATNMMASMATAPLEAALSQQLGLDMLKIDATGEESNVTVGKYLNPRTMIRVEQSLENSSHREVTIEYAVTRQLQIEASTDERGQSGLDLLYRLDKR
jgi:translocation and assembly module TamB